MRRDRSSLLSAMPVDNRTVMAARVGHGPWPRAGGGPLAVILQAAAAPAAAADGPAAAVSKPTPAGPASGPASGPIPNQLASPSLPPPPCQTATRVIRPGAAGLHGERPDASARPCPGKMGCNGPSFFASMWPSRFMFLQLTSGARAQPKRRPTAVDAPAFPHPCRSQTRRVADEPCIVSHMRTHWGKNAPTNRCPTSCSQQLATFKL